MDGTRCNEQTELDSSKHKSNPCTQQIKVDKNIYVKDREGTSLNLCDSCLRPSLCSYRVSLLYDSILLDAQSAFGAFPSKQWISNVASIEK